MFRFAIIPFFLVFSLATNLFADMQQKQMVSTSVQILKIFNQDYNAKEPKFKLPKRFSKDRIKAIVIIPDLVRAGVIATVLDGEGIFSLKKDDGTWSSPIFVKVKGAGLGAQGGYASNDAILLFDNTRSYSGLFDGTDTINVGADATLLGGLSKRHLTDTPKIAANVLVVGRSNGVFLGMSLESARISINDENNIDYYQRIYKYEDIVAGSPRANKQTKMLQEVLKNTFGN